MSRRNVLLVQLFMITWHISVEAVFVNLEKFPGGEPHRTPICSNSTDNFITIIVCKINMSLGRNCSLVYIYKQGFKQGCGPNVRLVMENQTIFLDLTSLTPKDSGIYNCECSTFYETKTINFNITVQEDEVTTSLTESSLIYLVTGVIFFIILTGVNLGYIHRKLHHCRRREIEQPPSPPEMEQSEDIEPYSTFIQRENGLYSIAVFSNCETNPPKVTQRKVSTRKIYNECVYSST